MKKEATKDAIGVAETDAPSPLGQLNWEDVRLFGVIAQTGSLRRASSCLQIQVSTLSRRLDALESALGLKLFERTPRGLILTEPGRRIASDVESIEMIMQGNAWRGRIQACEIRSEVKLVMSEGVAGRWFIPNFLNQFVERHPKVAVRLGVTHETGHTAIPPFDLQIQYAPAARESLNTVRIGTLHFMYFASRAYIERHGTPVSKDDLGHHRFADIMQALTAEYGTLGRYSNISKGQASLISNSALAVLAAVEAGTAIGLLPSYVYLLSRELVPVLASTEFEFGIYINYSATAAERPEVRAMIDFLKEVVFDRRKPWFADRFEYPNEEWRTLFGEPAPQQAGTFLH